MTMMQDSAETVALQALAWLAAHEDALLEAFLGATGVSEADLRRCADTPELLGAVLDFIMTNDAWVLSFCAAHGVKPNVPMMARAALPGGEQVMWT